MTEYLFAAVSFGFLGSLHCVGMCGGFAGAIAIGRPKSWQTGLIVYQFGRITTYAMLGLIVGLLGAELDEIGGEKIQIVVTVLVGAVMVVFGLNMTGIISDPLKRITFTISGFLKVGRHMQSLIQNQNTLGRLGGWLVVGLINGLLPCGLVYAALSMALAAESPETSILVMALFGVGTIPAMVLSPGVMRLLSPKLRGNVMRIAGAALIAYGIFTSVRGSEVMHLVHNHPVAYPDGRIEHHKNAQGEICTR